MFIQCTVDRSVIDVSYQIKDKQNPHKVISNILCRFVDDSMEIPPARLRIHRPLNENKIIIRDIVVCYVSTF